MLWSRWRYRWRRYVIGCRSGGRRRVVKQIDRVSNAKRFSSAGSTEQFIQKMTLFCSTTVVWRLGYVNRRQIEVVKKKLLINRRVARLRQSIRWCEARFDDDISINLIAAAAIGDRGYRRDRRQQKYNDRGWGPITQARVLIDWLIDCYSSARLLGSCQWRYPHKPIVLCRKNQNGICLVFNWRIIFAIRPTTLPYRRQMKCRCLRDSALAVMFYWFRLCSTKWVRKTLVSSSSSCTSSNNETNFQQININWLRIQNAYGYERFSVIEISLIQLFRRKAPIIKTILHGTAFV